MWFATSATNKSVSARDRRNRPAMVFVRSAPTPSCLKKPNSPGALGCGVLVRGLPRRAATPPDAGWLGRYGIQGGQAVLVDIVLVKTILLAANPGQQLGKTSASRPLWRMSSMPREGRVASNNLSSSSRTRSPETLRKTFKVAGIAARVGASTSNPNWVAWRKHAWGAGHLRRSAGWDRPRCAPAGGRCPAAPGEDR